MTFVRGGVGGGCNARAVGVLIAIAVVLKTIGIVRFAHLSRLNYPITNFRRVREVADVAALVGWLSAGAVCMLFVLARHREVSDWALVAGCMTAAAVITNRVLRVLVRRAIASGCESVRAFLARDLRERGKAAAVVSRQWVNIIAPDGWHEFRVRTATFERLLEARSVVVLYGIGLTVLPVFFAVGITRALIGAEPISRAVNAHVIGFNAIAVVSCLTAAAVLVALLLLAVRGLQLLSCRLDLRRAMQAVAAGTGYGTAAGFVTAALMPVMTLLLKQDGQAAVADPSLLIEIPAAGAVLGYGLGIASATAVLLRDASNLVLRRLVVPATLVAAAVALEHWGVVPSRIMNMATSDASVEYAGSLRAMCMDTDIWQAQLLNGAWIMRALVECGQAVRIDDSSYVSTVVVLATSVAVVALAKDIRERSRQVEGASDAARGADDGNRTRAISLGS